MILFLTFAAIVVGFFSIVYVVEHEIERRGR